MKRLPAVSSHIITESKMTADKTMKERRLPKKHSDKLFKDHSLHLQKRPLDPKGKLPFKREMKVGRVFGRELVYRGKGLWNLLWDL